MKTSAHYAVGMLQNVSQGRADKKITKQDFINITKTSILCHPQMYLNFKSQIDQNYLYSATLTLVQGTGENKCKIIWNVYDNIFNFSSVGYYNNIPANDATNTWACSLHSRYKGSPIKIGQEVNSNELYSDLRIKAGETKAILETCFYGRSVSATFVSNLFGLMLVQAPSYKNLYRTNEGSYFLNYVIFTPKPGIFTETAPN